ncbi:RidA family protein [Verticiella sediminum]|uniref:RidA family protein n=1 Tax=Verticiella sediminum TaxID=1247510 RepID=A0A556B235_9BURK|nr:RidA family protein [Verticiella sediminum]TSH99220.1 RidA family protein [Verticiella sediminum]
MSNRIDPDTVVPPAGPYSQAILSEGHGRWLHVSGQIGVLPDGALAGDFSAQARATWDNLLNVLAAAGMGVADLVEVTTYVVDPADLPALGPIRAGYLGDARPASTLVVAAALARPEWRIEVQAVAFQPA